MKTSEAGIAFIKGFEGCRLTAYTDAGGVLTVGYGHTRGVSAGQRVTEAEAEAYLVQDLLTFEKAVSALYPRATQTQFDALVSLGYNAGVGAVSGGLLSLIKDGADKNRLRRWWENHYITAGGTRLAGLVRRRKAEARLYLGGRYK